jgi:hypothetical protein
MSVRCWSEETVKTICSFGEVCGRPAAIGVRLPRFGVKRRGPVLLASAGGALALALDALIVLAGLDLVVTGALGHCPLYRRLGHVPASLRRPA